MSLSKPSRESPRESLDPEDRPITLPTGEIVVPVVNSFPSLIRVAFMDMIQADDYVSKDRLAPDQWARTHVFLDNPKTKAIGQRDRNTKSFAQSRYELVQNRLYRQASGKHPRRYAVPQNEVFEIIKAAHLKIGHAGRDKTFMEVSASNHGISQTECEWMATHCKFCTLNRGREGKRPLEPITVSRVWERIQTDLIDMRHTPDGRYAWILHIKDHYSKYTQLYALKGKDSEGIAECLAMFIMAFYPPEILQCDNGKEFKGRCFIYFLILGHASQPSLYYLTSANSI
jgi:hypothetical protein